MNTKDIQYLITTLGVMFSILSFTFIKITFDTKDDVEHLVYYHNTKVEVGNSIPETTTPEIIVNEDEEPTTIEATTVTTTKKVTTTTKKIVTTKKVNKEVLYDGLNEQELTNKINRFLKNEMAGTGSVFVDYYKKTGLDPYIAIAISLHETGCNGKCYYLAVERNNFGGMFSGGKLIQFETKEIGLQSYLDNLYRNYWNKGLKTTKQINKKYATNPNWYKTVDYYISEIKKA